MLHALAFLALMQTPAEAPKYDMKLLPFCVLKEGSKESRPAALFTEHINYLESLWESRKAILVGPVEGAGDWAGIVVFNTTKEEAEALIQKDPFVAKGFMKTEFYEWFFARNVPLKGPKFTDIEPYWFGKLERPKDAPDYPKEELEKIQEGHMANINRMAESGDLVLAGPMGGKSDWRGIFIFRDMDKEKVEALSAKDPAIQKGRLKLTLSKWLMSKGTFPAAKKSD